MTRAAERLYLAGHAGALTREEIETGHPKPPPEDPLEWSWHQLVSAAFETLPDIEIETRHGPRRIRRRLSAIGAAAPAVADPHAKREEAGPLPAWLREPAPPDEPAPAPPLRPSKARVVTADETRALEASRLGGVLIHRLYEALPGLPPEHRDGAARTVITNAAPDMPDETRDDLARAVLAAIDSQTGRYLFGPASRAEVTIAGEVTLASGITRPVRGRIDRLIVAREAVTIVDIKSGRPRQAVRDADILRQMALYQALLIQLYPDRPVRCVIFWAETGAVETLPSEALERAFALITEA
jgi:ATP-dependent helicase/nuclease subunit A